METNIPIFLKVIYLYRNIYTLLYLWKQILHIPYYYCVRGTLGIVLVETSHLINFVINNVLSPLGISGNSKFIGDGFTDCFDK